LREGLGTYAVLDFLDVLAFSTPVNPLWAGTLEDPIFSQADGIVFGGVAVASHLPFLNPKGMRATRCWKTYGLEDSLAWSVAVA